MSNKTTQKIKTYQNIHVGNFGLITLSTAVSVLLDILLIKELSTVNIHDYAAHAKKINTMFMINSFLTFLTFISSIIVFAYLYYLVVGSKLNTSYHKIINIVIEFIFLVSFFTQKRYSVKTKLFMIYAHLLSRIFIIGVSYMSTADSQTREYLKSQWAHINKYQPSSLMKSLQSFRSPKPPPKKQKKSKTSGGSQRV